MSPSTLNSCKVAWSAAIVSRGRALIALHSGRLNSKAREPRAYGKWYKARWTHASDRYRPFAHHELRLRRGSPRGWGVPKSLAPSISLDRRWSHAQIFYLRPRVLIQSDEIKQS